MAASAPGPGDYSHRSLLGEKARRESVHGGPQRGFGGAARPVAEGPVETRLSPSGSLSGPKDIVGGGGGPSFSVTPRRSAANAAGPGPGEYNHKDLLVEKANSAAGVKQTGFGGSVRPVRDGESHEQWRQETRADAAERGPGTYSFRDLAGSGGPGFSVTPRREEALRAGPGPGEYDHRADIGESARRCPSIGQRGFGGSPRPVRDGQTHEPWRERSAGELERAVDTVGPGAYSFKDLVGSGGPGFSATPRREEAFPAGPGPGEYDHKELIGEGGKSGPLKQRGFGASARPVRDGESHEQWRQEKSPDGLERGPGTYDLKGLIGSGGPGFSATPRRAVSARQAPGPGEYEHQDLLSSRAASVPSPGGQRGFGASGRPVADGVRADRRPLRATGPAPGDYGRSGDTTLGDGPKFSLSSRTDLRPQVSPGPGEYLGHLSQFV